MLISSPVAFTFRGKPAWMRVVRNNGECWGRIDVPGDPDRYDVTTGRDWYAYPDDEAAQAFIRASRHEDKVSGALTPG